MTPDGIRYSHPDPAEIGRSLPRHDRPAPRRAAPSSRRSPARSARPCARWCPWSSRAGSWGWSRSGRPSPASASEMTRQLPLLAGPRRSRSLLAGVGSWLASRWLRRTTHDLGPAELSRMYEYYDAVLHAVREGLLLLDRAGRLQLLNDEARRLLALPDDAVGRHVDELGLPAALGGALASGAERGDEIFLTDDRVVVVSQAARPVGRPAAGHGRDAARPHRAARPGQRAEDDPRVRRGAVGAGARVGEPAADRDRADRARPRRGRAAVRRDGAGRRPAPHRRRRRPVGEPELAALVLGKAAEAGERGVELQVDDDIEVPAASPTRATS